MKTIVSVSGGLGSAHALKLAIEQGNDVDAVFADVKGTGYSHFWSEFPEIEYLLQERFGGESPDTYRFLWELAYHFDKPIERIEDGRSIWAIFGETRCFRIFAGGMYVCKASAILKREAIAKYIEKTYQPGTYRMALGMGVLEPHRIKNATKFWQHRLGWEVEVYSPIQEHYKATGVAIENCDTINWLMGAGIAIPSAYYDNMPHNNCMEVCSNAGQSQFAFVYRNYNTRYWYAAWQEYRLRTKLGIDATILKDQRGGTTKPLTLYDFADRVEAGDVNEKDLGGSCSCFTYAPQQQPAA